MSRFGYVSPGFSVYKANIIPFLEGEKKVHCKEMNEQVVNQWERALLSMKGFVEQVYLYARPIVEKLTGDERRYRTYELIGDAITSYFRIPLLRDPLMGLAPSPLIYYAAARFYYPETRRLLRCDPVSFIENIMDRVKEFSRAKEFSSGAEIERLWFSLPADTRPLYNTSGLIPHLLVTSAISWGLAINDGLGREEAAKLRLAAIFHDISKPFNFREHYKLAPEILEDILGGVLDGATVVELREYIAHHHVLASTSQSSILQKADMLASSSDRLSYLRKELVDPRLRNERLDPDIGYGSGEKAWDFWRKLEPDHMRILSEEVAEDLFKSSIGLEKKIDIGRRDNRAGGGLRIALVDLGAIQEFISRTRDLRSVAASSLVVDSVTLAHLPLLIQSVLDDQGYWVPLESYLVMSGGSLTLLLPQGVAGMLHDLWDDEIASLLGEVGLAAYFASTDFTGDYYYDSGQLAARMSYEKLTHEPRGKCVEIVSMGESTPDFCELCYSSSRIVNSRYCSLCEKLHKLGSEIHFRNKWERGFRLGLDTGKGNEIIPRKCFDSEYGDIARGDVMYLIAGHPHATLQLGERKRNLAVIKVDGNLMGEFFAGALSLSDAIERSARVDMALKTALERAAADLYSGVELSSYRQPNDPERAVSSFFLGLMYEGGDDALIICPSWCALPIAYSVYQNFYRELGGVRALSAGVAAAPPEHDIWALIDAAAKLLDEAKKKIGHNTPDTGGIAFDYIEGGVLSGSSTLSRLYTSHREGLPCSLSAFQIIMAAHR